jgi:hypothetical protein
MRQRLLCLVASAVLCTLGATVVRAAPPAIERVEIYRERDIHPDWGGIDYHDQVAVHVSDADGADDIASISVTDPDGRTRTMPASPGSHLSEVRCGDPGDNPYLHLDRLPAGNS